MVDPKILAMKEQFKKVLERTRDLEARGTPRPWRRDGSLIRDRNGDIVADFFDLDDTEFVVNLSSLFTDLLGTLVEICEEEGAK